MEKIDDNFKSLFSQFKECHSCISPLNQKLERDHPNRKLFEAFSLRSGAFYHLCLYYNNYPELFKNSQKKNEENWNIFSKTQNYQAFCSNFFPPSEIIQLDFISMCIANAAFRLSAAGELVCDVIQKSTSMNVKYVTANGLINAFLIQMTATAAGIENYCIKKARTGVKL